MAVILFKSEGQWFSLNTPVSLTNNIITILLKYSSLHLEGDNLVVFYYLSASEIWPDNRDGL